MFWNDNQANEALLYQSYFQQVYRNQSAYQRFSQQEFSELQANNICATYGELDYISVVRLLKHAQLSPSDIFLDLGSGNGKLCLQVFLQTAIAKVLGIEAIAELVTQAKGVKQQLLTDLNYNNPEHILEFTQGNFLTTDWESATVLYCCSTCFTRECLDAIGDKINREVSVRQVFSLRPLPTLERLTLKQVFLVECSWDSALCFHYSV